MSARGAHETQCPGAVFGAGHVGMPCLVCKISRLPKKAGVQYKPHCLYSEFRHSYQFWQWWEFLQNPSSQMPAKNQPFKQVLLRRSLKTARAVLISPILQISKLGKRCEVTLAQDHSHLISLTLCSQPLQATASEKSHYSKRHAIKTSSVNRFCHIL